MLVINILTMSTIRSTIKELARKVFNKMLKRYDGKENLVPKDFAYPLPPLNDYIAKALSRTSTMSIAL